MRGRFGWIGAGVLLLGIVAILAVGFTALGGTDLLAGAGADKTERAKEPTGAKKDPPKAAQEPEKEQAKKEEPKEEESKKDEPDEELNNKEQAKAAEKEPTPTEASAEASASAAASAPADTTMTLEVPAIGLSVPVYEGTGEASLSAGTGHLSGTGYPWIPGSNTYVAGHRIGYPGTASDYVFWDLPSLVEGDEVYLTDANGKTYTYAVSEILEVPITDLSVTAPVAGRDVVSLQTCIENYGDYWTPGPNWYVRYVVRADKVA
ncbi:sortase [Rubrobacter tropicus]|uniref:Sortase n=1 Tax=Rubrobacter tropicus TaxID=2653851 RepID=A0A6G8QC39_9ACTN|nr:class E sortase [Rubrobacter tropicus]QIN84074.1 sortase [Rubrobacter tropicus]